MKMFKLVPLKSDGLQKFQLTYSAQMKMLKLVPLKSDGLQKFQLTYSAKMKMPKLIPLKSDDLQKFQLTLNKNGLLARPKDGVKWHPQRTRHISPLIIV